MKGLLNIFGLHLGLSRPRNPKQEHYGWIIGRGGSTLKSIQDETGARIIIPRGDGPIRITGTIHSINAAKMKIQSISMEQTMFKERREAGVRRLQGFTVLICRLSLYKSLVIESSSRVPNQTCWKNSKARRFQKEKWRTQNLVEFDRSWTRWGHQTEVLLQFYSRNLRAFRGNCRS